jgi:hypothetical protein
MDRFHIAYGDQAVYYAGQELGIELYMPTFEQQAALKQFYEGRYSKLLEAALHSFKMHNEQSQWRRPWPWEATALSYILPSAAPLQKEAGAQSGIPCAPPATDKQAKGNPEAGAV